MKSMFTNACMLLFLLLPAVISAQTRVTGYVRDTEGNPLPGANIIVKGTYEGTTTDNDGFYSFNLKKKDKITLTASFIGHEIYEKTLPAGNSELSVDFVLREKINRIDAVTISAGMFEAGDEKKSVILNSLDIATTAGSGADVIAALKTLPGTSVAGNKTGLYVRGGEGREAATYIDGLKVSHPFYSPVPDISQRGRFDPFLFQGTYFSTGGYSAEYGQALSSALILNTENFPEQTFTSIDLMTVGIGGGHYHKSDNTALGLFTSYTNLQPYYGVVEQQTQWEKPVEAINGTMLFRQRLSKTGLLKLYFHADNGAMSMYRTNMDNYPQKILFDINNRYLFSNLSYTDQLNKKWLMYAGFSAASNKDNISEPSFSSTIRDDFMHSKIRLKRYIGELSGIKAGAEYQLLAVNENKGYDDMKTKGQFFAGFCEGDMYLTNKLVLRAGLRGEYASLTGKTNLAPRSSIAYKTGEYSQVSFAWGLFHQTPEKEYITQGLKQYEKASHYILNYQFLAEHRTFRIETYYKDYHKLVRTSPALSVNGYGYARGIDLFWRDKRTIDGIDYWISYSWLDTKRLYLDYPKETTPDYVSNHTMTCVYKHFIPTLRSNIGFTYIFASGRPYNNPNNDDFMSEKTKKYHDVSFNISYLTSVFGSFAVLVASINNIFGFEHIHGYRYSHDGFYREPIIDPAKRGFFMGMFISFGRNNADDF